MVNHGAADHEGITEMHAGHGGKRIDKVAAHPDRGCVVVAHRIQETVFRREQPRRHAGVKSER